MNSTNNNQNRVGESKRPPGIQDQDVLDLIAALTARVDRLEALSGTGARDAADVTVMIELAELAGRLDDPWVTAWSLGRFAAVNERFAAALLGADVSIDEDAVDLGNWLRMMAKGPAVAGFRLCRGHRTNHGRAYRLEVVTE